MSLYVIIINIFEIYNVNLLVFFFILHNNVYYFASANCYYNRIDVTYMSSIKF